jgi:hypothetical protein
VRWHEPDDARVSPVGMICEGLGVKFPGPTRHSRRFDPPPTTSVFPGKQTFSAATPTGCKRFERGAGAVYKKRAGVISRHHDDTMMRDENRVKKCEKYLILLNNTRA